jgi:radical SAM/Cys-rich protein
MHTSDAIESSSSFQTTLAAHGVSTPARRSVSTVQINVGKLCNQACHHCHVDAGPKRSERMIESTAREIVGLLENSSQVEVVDLTGGAPELNEHFRYIVESARALGLRVIDRCNLTVLFEAGMRWLPEFFVENQIHIVSSLPCYHADNVDAQRGVGVFDKSIEALRVLNGLGYGSGNDDLRLDLVFNPLDDTLPPPQELLQQIYREELARLFDLRFDSLLTITNMPIKRFADQLARWGRLSEYMSLLVNHFSPMTVEHLMCRDLVSVGWDGQLYDCDFNQMLDIPISGGLTLADLTDFDTLAPGLIATGSHCLGCTAGSGSGCGGALSR